MGDHLKKVFKKNDTSSTLAAVIGSPVTHSLSPILHNAAFDFLKMKWEYVALEITERELEEVLEQMRLGGLGGLSVTMPFKTIMASLVDSCTPTAQALNAVNCVVSTEEGLIGHNTDGDGFLNGLIHDAQFDPRGKKAAVIGAGGAARAVIEALARSGVTSITVINRTLDKAESAADLAGEIGRVGTPEDIPETDLVVNATSLGMKDNSEFFPCPIELLHPNQIVADLIYHPLETPWILETKQKGINSYNGVSMLLFQAVEAFTLWTGKEAPISVMQGAITQELTERTYK
ncbi:MAG TPA: shikimate dehydrogenase [Acidimicrobiales bacterium]|nr:shikimate dehydrogenase [Acidimicrobiales bacterium]